ncbi:MAG: hypothetical protein WCH79_20570, partial [Planctomycetia bacterium]
LALNLPERRGLERPVPDQGQAERILGLIAGEALGGVDHPSQFVALGKLTVLGGDTAGDLLQLGMVWQFMVNTYEEFVELGRELRDGVIRRFKTGHASALENRPPGGGYRAEESSSSDLRAKGFGSVRRVCAGLPVSGGIAAA